MDSKHRSILATMVALCLVGSAALAGAAQEPVGDPERGGHDGNRGNRAAHGEHRGRMGPDRMVDMMTRRLELDETQTEQVQNIVLAAKPEFDVLRETGAANREAIRNLNMDDADYGAKLSDLSAQSGDLAASSSELRGRVRAEIHAILTPEQRKKLESAAANRGSGEHRNRGRNGRRNDAQ